MTFFKANICLSFLATLEECCMASADMQLLVYSGERIVAHGPLVKMCLWIVRNVRNRKYVGEFFAMETDFGDPTNAFGYVSVFHICWEGC